MNPPQSNRGVCCCCKCDGDVATCGNVLPLLLVLLLHSCCYTFVPSSSCYYYIAATWDVMMVALLLPHEMWWWLHSGYYTRCDNGINFTQTKKTITTLKCGLGVWMGRWVPEGREVGRCKKLGHLEGRKNEGLLGPKFWVPRPDELGFIPLSAHPWMVQWWVLSRWGLYYVAIETNIPIL
jgi:hypothetical protein